MSDPGGPCRVSIGRSMAKQQTQIDNHFTPGSQAEDTSASWGVVFITIFGAVFVAAFGLGRSVGAW